MIYGQCIFPCIHCIGLAMTYGTQWWPSVHWPWTSDGLVYGGLAMSYGHDLVMARQTSGQWSGCRLSGETVTSTHNCQSALASLRKLLKDCYPLLSSCTGYFSKLACLIDCSFVLVLFWQLSLRNNSLIQYCVESCGFIVWNHAAWLGETTHSERR